jgi:enolase
VNLINGGKHASNDLDFQEFIIMPVGATSFMQAMEIASEVNLVLGEILVTRYGKSAVNVGDEGGYAPPMSDPELALGLLHEAVDKAGYGKAVIYGLDCAATHLYDAKTTSYTVMGRTIERDELVDYYEKLRRDYGVVSFEDPLQEDDFAGFAQVTKRLGAQVVGDDLFVTNTGRLKKGIEMGAANALLFKVNQIGTLSEALDAAAMARSAGYSVVVSERSGETEDSLISDLVVGLDAGQIKTGAPVRGERTAKYNRLLAIAEELGNTGRYAGQEYRNPTRLSGRS